MKINVVVAVVFVCFFFFINYTVCNLDSGEKSVSITYISCLMYFQIVSYKFFFVLFFSRDHQALMENLDLKDQQ